MTHTRAWRNFKRMEDSVCLFAGLIYMAAVLHAWRVLPGAMELKAIVTLAAPAGFMALSALLPLRLQEAGFSSSEIGVLAAGFSGGFLIGCIYAPHLVRRIGHIRTFSTFATILSALTLALAIDTQLLL